MPALILMLLFLGACASGPVCPSGQGESRSWSSGIIPVSPDWTRLGEIKVALRSPVSDSTLTTADSIRTEIFFRPGPDTPDILLLSRVRKTGSTVAFSFLGGHKTSFGGRYWRENTSGLFSNSTDPEYRRYFDMLRAKNVSLAPAYRVRVLDRLPVETALVRVMEFSPARTASTLPPFRRLYPQERRERIVRPSFRGSGPR